MSESEAAQIRLGLEEWDESPWEWGVYVERDDKGDWTPVVYGGEASFEDARERWIGFLAATDTGLYRNPRIVRRAVSPWEVRHGE